MALMYMWLINAQASMCKMRRLDYVHINYCHSVVNTIGSAYICDRLKRKSWFFLALWTCLPILASVSRFWKLEWTTSEEWARININKSWAGDWWIGRWRAKHSARSATFGIGSTSSQRSSSHSPQLRLPSTTSPKTPCSTTHSLTSSAHDSARAIP